ncbi:MAG: uncharacterized protein JWN96_315 [Mycobacterium sp.]|nr:uncharacterized protein [Mycobacterium sp.]
MPVPMDEFPLHQHPVSFARVGTSDRNFYDRSYFNGHDRTGEIFFISGYGVYPNLGVKDAYFTIRIGDDSFTVRASDALDDDRMNTQVGFYKHEVIEPLNVIRLSGSGDEHGIGFDLTWRGSFPAIDEPLHVILQGGVRPFVDSQRFAQVGTWEGEIRVNGRVIDVNPDTWVGSRDRSWGIRPVGESEPAGRFAAEQGGDYGMFWLYAPIRFDDYAIVVIVQEDADGHRILNEASRIWPAESGRKSEQLGWPRFEINYKSGTRIPETAVMHLTEPDGKPLDVEIDNLGFISLNCGPGYGIDPEWTHGSWKGRDWADGSSINYTDEAVQGRIPFSLLDHVTKATIGTDVGYGLFEHGLIGTYRPFGFNDFFAVAP